MQLSKYFLFTFGLAACSGFVACKTAPPQELNDARARYQQVAAGPAATQAPADVDNAKKALDRAEKAFKDDPEASETKDYAYIAERKARLAQAKAAAQDARTQKSRAEKQRELANKENLAEAKSELQDAKADLAASQRENEDSTKELAGEKQLRQKSEEENKELTASLLSMATVKEDERGTVISLSGGALFASGKSTLLPAARTALDSVASALNKRTAQVVAIEGHTDSVGSADSNQQLSTSRAEAVRAYLIEHGVDSSRIEVSGFGASRPVADNATADGRANNRRVEIVLKNARS